MALFLITTTIPTDRGFVWYPLRVDGVETVQEFAERIRRDGVIHGWKFKEVRDRALRERGEKAYTKHEHALGLSMLGTCELAPSRDALAEIERRVQGQRQAA